MSGAEVMVDVVVAGGGVAGLWTAAALRHAGYSVLVLEGRGGGGGGSGVPGQSIGAQGIIHGGMKYALTGEASAAARAIAGMPAAWEAALAGRSADGVDLRYGGGVRVLSPCTYLWTTPGVLSKLAGFAASRVLRTAVSGLDRGAWPAGLAGASKGISVYRVEEPVLAVDGVMAALHRQAGVVAAGRLGGEVVGEVDAARGEVVLRRAAGGGGVGGAGGVVRAKQVLLLAGAGNVDAARALGAGGGNGQGLPAAQTRPLHMVMVRWPKGVSAPAEVFGHCVGPSNLPKLTITSATDSGGRRVMYLGGEVAEQGVKRDAAEQISAAKAVMAQCVPWVDVRGAEWGTCRWERAEAATKDGSRPDVPVLVEAGAGGGAGGLVVMGWPTKLAFAPRLAAMCGEHVRGRGVVPSGGAGAGGAEAARAALGLDVARAAPLPWEDGGVEWRAV
ncbi:MAG: hypothetical protein ACK5ZV_10875 [bacterium]